MTNTNHLIHETSPYLLNHAHNPVDWYPWGEEALERARKENKPILLSIGYAACHWCHVMAHESFEDEGTAKLMNQWFINIKVDREERPDLDKIYQTAHYLLTRQNGGWPLTLFLNPHDLVPFFSGTYFPLLPRYELPAFKQILQAINDIFATRYADIQKQNASLMDRLHQPAHPVSEENFSKQPFELALQVLEERYDEINGGFFKAPKFPHPSILQFLLSYIGSEGQNSVNGKIISMVVNTLKHMAEGGIYDHLSGGFYRYTVDEKWQIPHFEKMLYDNGQLLHLYACRACTCEVEYNHLGYFADIVRCTAHFILEEMQSAEGGYYSSIDADSEGEEGKFYLWDKQEIESLLTNDEYKVVHFYLGLDEPPAFPPAAWHLHQVNSLTQVAALLNISFDEAKNRWVSAKEKLLTARNKRCYPARDEKILTGWNSLMIKGMLSAGEVLKEPRFLESAAAALFFLQKRMWVNHRLLAVYKDNKAHLRAYLDDYVFLLDAILLSLQVSWKTSHLYFAIELAQILLTHFYDDKNGGFYFTAHDHEKLLYRPKPLMDEAIPSGNGTAVQALLLLGYLLGETRYIEAAEKTLRAAWHSLTAHPAEHTSLLLGLKAMLEPAPIVVLRGNEEQLKAWKEIAKTKNADVFAIPKDESLPEALMMKKPSGDICAYVCQGQRCLAVITDIDEFKNSLAGFM